MNSWKMGFNYPTIPITQSIPTISLHRSTKSAARHYVFSFQACDILHQVQVAKEPDAAQVYAGHLPVAVVKVLFSAVNCSHDWSQRPKFTARADAVPLASLELYLFIPAVNTAMCMW